LQKKKSHHKELQKEATTTCFDISLGIYYLSPNYTLSSSEGFIVEKKEEASVNTSVTDSLLY
jgi:hypothetical protein